MPSVENYSNVAISVYADDTNISVRSGSVDRAVGKLNFAIALLEPRFQKWRIKVNAQKCTLTLFSRRFRHNRGGPRRVKIFNETIAWTTESKYLGVSLDSKLTYRTHTSCILRKANYRPRQLFPILNRSSTIDINIALIIYKSLLRSMLTYASPV
jgi:hypothetical protein